MIVKGFQTFEEFLTEKWGESKLQKELQQKYKDVIKSLTIHENDDCIDLNFIVIKSDEREKGWGEKIMKDIIAYSEKVKKPIILSPEDSHGTELTKLENWYRKFGFEYEDGQKYGYLFCMVRNP